MSFKFMRQGFVLLIFSFFIAAVLVAAECVAEENRPVWTPADGLKGILDTGGDVEQKTLYIKEYLGKKYARSYGGQRGVRVTLNRYERLGVKRLHSYGSIALHGDFTPPGFLPEGETEDDMRMLALAFLEEEKELFGLAKADEDVKIWDEVDMYHPRRNIPSEVSFRVRYKRYVEGIELNDRAEVFFDFNFSYGKPERFESRFVPVTPEMAEAAKRFNEVGITEDAAKEAVLVKVLSLGFVKVVRGYVPKIDCWVKTKSPYVVCYGTYGNAGVTLNAFTGEVLRWDPLIIVD